MLAILGVVPLAAVGIGLGVAALAGMIFGGCGPQPTNPDKKPDDEDADLPDGGAADIAVAETPLPDLREAADASDQKIAEEGGAPDLRGLDGGRPDFSVRDLAGVEAGGEDLAGDQGLGDFPLGDLAFPDAFIPDLSARDLGMADLSRGDSSGRDVAGPDLAKPDLASRDLTTVPGVNLNAAAFSGPISDLDATPKGELIAFGGNPSSVLLCVVNGLQNAACAKKAELPLPGGHEPKGYHSTSFGYGIANAEPQVGNPFSIFRSKEWEAKPDPKAVLADTLKEIRISGMPFVQPYFPRGIAAHRAQQPPRDIFFMAMKRANANAASAGLVVRFSNSGTWATREMLLFPEGLETSGLAMTEITVNAMLRSVLVVLNTGRINPADAFTAGFALFDPEAKQSTILKKVSLGEVEAAPLPELPLDAGGKTAYAVIEKPSKELAAANLETGAVTKIALAGKLQGAAVDLAISGGLAAIADRGGRALFVDLAKGSAKGTFTLPAEPTALAFVGSILYAAVREGQIAWLVAIDPALAPLTP